MLCLSAYGANVNAQDDFLETPLMNAACCAGFSDEAEEVVNSLLRSGADETIVNKRGETAAGEFMRKPENEHTKRILELLASAPANRAWRRRGYLVLCRALPDRVIGGTRHADKAWRTDGGRELVREEATGVHETLGDGHVDETDGGDWVVVLAKVLGLQEEGLFRTIVGYL